MGVGLLTKFGRLALEVGNVKAIKCPSVVLIVLLESTDLTVTCPPPGGPFPQQTQLNAAVEG